MSNRHHRRAAHLALALTIVAAALAFSQPAFAANFTTSQITTPGGTSFVQYTPQAPNTLHVEATVAGGSSNADLVCFWGNSRTIVAENVQVADGGIIADVPLNKFTQRAPLPYCVLRAVPVGDPTNYPPNAPSPFAGVRIGGGKFEVYKSNGAPSDYRLQQAQSHGYSDYYSAGACGLASARLIDPVTFEPSYELFWCGGWLGTRNGSATASPTQEQGTRSEIRVDGVNAYLSAAARDLYYIDATTRSAAINGIPELSVQESVDPANGNVHISEASGLVRCAPDATAFHTSTQAPEWATECSSFAGVGVKLERTIASDRDGRRTTMTDVWSSTDGQSHQLELQYEEDFTGDVNNPSPIVDHTWLGGGKATLPDAGDTIPGPTSGAPATVYLDGNGYAANNSAYPLGAVTYAPAPDDVHWVYAAGSFATGLWRYARSLPASGSVKIVHVYSSDTSYAVLSDQAAADRDQAGTPAISIAGPADGSTLASPGVTVTGTAEDLGGSIASVTVNGEAANVAPDGTWSTGVTLAEGKNTITAVARDTAGNMASASVTVTYAKPPATGTDTPGAGGKTPDLVPPVLGLSIKRVRLGALLKKGLPITVRSSEAARLKAVLTIGPRAHALRIGAKASALSASGSKKVTVKLSRKAKRKLAQMTKVRVKVTVSAVDAARNAATKTKALTVRR